jgi:hypothetical protein
MMPSLAARYARRDAVFERNATVADEIDCVTGPDGAGSASCAPVLVYPYCPPRGLPHGSRKLLVRAGLSAPSLEGGLPLLLLSRLSWHNSAILLCRLSINSLLSKQLPISASKASSVCPQHRADSPAESLAA